MDTVVRPVFGDGELPHVRAGLFESCADGFVREILIVFT
jgi:hypothetical protein